MRVLLLAFSLLVACSGAAKNKKPMTIDLRVSDLNDDDAAKLEEEIAKIPGVKNVRADPFSSVMTYTFEYNGNYDHLRHRISKIPYPGLRPQSESIQLEFEGFDNRPPKVELISPKDGSTIAEIKTDVVVQVEDSDVANVNVNGVKARKTKQNLYGARVPLAEGDNTLKVVATDKAENKTEETYRLKVDTTPPDLEASVKVVVEGKVDPGSTVFVDGKEASVNLFGNWRIELTVKRGQRSVEVVAIDKVGNKTTEQKPIGM